MVKSLEFQVWGAHVLELYGSLSHRIPSLWPYLQRPKDFLNKTKDSWLNTQVSTIKSIPFLLFFSNLLNEQHDKSIVIKEIRMYSVDVDVYPTNEHWTGQR